jgi:hypothetical protein
VFHWQQQLLLLPVFSAGNPKTTEEIQFSCFYHHEKESTHTNCVSSSEDITIYIL